MKKTEYLFLLFLFNKNEFLKEFIKIFNEYPHNVLILTERLKNQKKNANNTKYANLRKAQITGVS
jgi:hypothetical protein